MRKYLKRLVSDPLFGLSIAFAALIGYCFWANEAQQSDLLIIDRAGAEHPYDQNQLTQTSGLLGPFLGPIKIRSRHPAAIWLPKDNGTKVLRTGDQSAAPDVILAPREWGKLIGHDPSLGNYRIELRDGPLALIEIIVYPAPRRRCQLLARLLSLDRTRPCTARTAAHGHLPFSACLITAPEDRSEQISCEKQDLVRKASQS